MSNQALRPLGLLRRGSRGEAAPLERGEERATGATRSLVEFARRAAAPAGLLLGHGGPPLLQLVHTAFAFAILMS